MEQEFAKQNEPGAKDAAYASMRRAIAADPQNPDTFDRFARMQYALTDYRAALETGARFGPSLMPGGAADAWKHLEPIWNAIAAKVPEEHIQNQRVD